MTSNIGAMLVNPRGGVENVDEMAAAGVKWLALNVRDFPVRDWATVWLRCHQHNITYLPWCRIGNPGDSRNVTLEWCKRLMLVADAMAEDQSLPDTLAFVNAETEIKPPELGGVVSPADVARVIAGRWQVAISTEGRVYDMDWTPLLHLPVLLQIFPTDMSVPFDPAAVEVETKVNVLKAGQYGFRNVGVTYQSYREAPPTLYPFRDGTAWSIYPGDNVGVGNWGRCTAV